MHVHASLPAASAFEKRWNVAGSVRAGAEPSKQGEKPNQELVPSKEVGVELYGRSPVW